MEIKDRRTSGGSWEERTGREGERGGEDSREEEARQERKEGRRGRGWRGEVSKRREDCRGRRFIFTWWSFLSIWF